MSAAPSKEETPTPPADGRPAPADAGEGNEKRRMRAATGEADQPDWHLVLTEHERRLMLTDIASVALSAAGALWPETAWEDLDVSTDPARASSAPAERLGWLARLLPELTEAIAQIVRDPLTRLEPAARPIAPPARARRVTPSAWAGAVQRGHAARWVNETTTRLTPDTPANRAVHGFLRALLADCSALAKAADTSGEGEWRKQAQTLAARLRALLSHPFWYDVSASPLPFSFAAGTSRAPYARLVQWMRQYQQGFAFDWNSPLFQLPARQTWQIYEAWCALQTLSALQGLDYLPAPSASGTLSPLLSKQAGRVSVRLARGTESGLLLRGPHGERMRLWINPIFEAGRRSRSRALSPDMALEDAEGRLWLLDAKLKGYGEPGEEAADINQMHAYRDAILGRDGTPCIQRAWCLYAGALGGGGRKQIAYGPAEGSVVGGLRLRPGQPEGFASLRTLLARWLSQET